jgi:multiple antibiotic resistance protein
MSRGSRGGCAPCPALWWTRGQGRLRWGTATVYIAHAQPAGEEIGGAMKEYFQAAVTVFAVVNPVVSTVILLKLASGQPARSQLLAATKAVLTVLAILVAAAFLGRLVLHTFGISMSTFRVVGGVIIAYLGFQMLSGRSSDFDGQKGAAPGLTPLVMFAASPGTIATVVTLSAVHTPEGLPLTALVAVGVVMAITWIMMAAMIVASGHIHVGGQQFVSRFMGLILVAMGLQFVLDGLKAFMTTG